MSLHETFHYFLSDESKQNAATTAELSKPIIELLKNRTVLFADMSNIWGNIYYFGDQYHCATALYLLSVLAHAYNIIIDSGFRELVRVIEVVGGLNDIYKNLLSIFMTTLQLTDAAAYKSQMPMHTSNAKIYIILARGFQKTSFRTNTCTWLVDSQ